MIAINRILIILYIITSSATNFVFAVNFVGTCVEYTQNCKPIQRYLNVYKEFDAFSENSNLKNEEIFNYYPIEVYQSYHSLNASEKIDALRYSFFLKYFIDKEVIEIESYDNEFCIIIEATHKGLFELIRNDKRIKIRINFTNRNDKDNWLISDTSYFPYDKENPSCIPTQ